MDLTVARGGEASHFSALLVALIELSGRFGFENERSAVAHLLLLRELCVPTGKAYERSEESGSKGLGVSLIQTLDNASYRATHSIDKLAPRL